MITSDVTVSLPAYGGAVGDTVSGCVVGVVTLSGVAIATVSSSTCDVTDDVTSPSGMRRLVDDVTTSFVPYIVVKTSSSVVNGDVIVVAASPSNHHAHCAVHNFANN